MAEKKVTENEAAPKKTVKKTITKVDSAKATTPAEKPSTKTAAKAATPVTAADKSSAKTKRILAVVFWVLAIACEVLAVLVFIGKIDLKFISQMAQLIAFLVIDFILVVVGAQFWKQANHMDPVSEQNKVKFWLWNNMGVIVCCFAFIPFLIYVLFIDKNADPKMKKVAAIVAAVALVLGIGISYDWNPVSEEGKAQAESTLGDTSVYWTQFGSVYHLDTECQHLNRSSELFEGDVATAIEKGKTRLCKTCAKNFNIEIADNGAILTTTPLTAAVEEVVEDVAEEPAA
ncbi:MAG: hypothetical protein IIT86_01135 [Oscillospiraceae bacterium]|jgi:hypothetical protein|nr:hypothetical protein [Oscillospiraceae bacterium]